MKFFMIMIAVISLGCTTQPKSIKISPEKLAHRKTLYKEGRICDKCAADNFVNYQPCWKVTPEQIADGKKACSVCVAWGKCCKTEETECCCWDVRETCYKKCKIPRIPVKKL